MSMLRKSTSAKTTGFAPANFEDVPHCLVELYSKKVRDLERDLWFDRFSSPLLADGELLAKPMVLLIGQYSSGKTTFCKYLAGGEFPGLHIGPEPTTDGFVALMDGTSPTVVPGNAATSSKLRPFHSLNIFGSAFLNKFCISECDCELTSNITLIDTPGILAGSKQTMGRSYDYERVVRWFAERSDLILLLFDSHKVDVSDEFKAIIDVLQGHDEKMRLVLNKADALSTEELMHVYGGTMWFLGKVFKTPEVKRSYMSSFWDERLRNPELERFMIDERERLLKDLYQLPIGARTRRVNEFIRRVRSSRAHALVMTHLRRVLFGEEQQGSAMPSIMGQGSAKRRLIENLDGEFNKIAKTHGIPITDFPNVKHYQRQLEEYDFTKLPKVDKKQLALYEEVLDKDIPAIMAFFANTALNQHVVMEKKGWLKKQSTAGKWQNRYFKLKNGILDYYHKPEGADVAGSMCLSLCTCVAKPESDRHFTITIIAPDRPYNLAATSADEMAAWLLTIQANCGNGDPPIATTRPVAGPVHGESPKQTLHYRSHTPPGPPPT